MRKSTTSGIGKSERQKTKNNSEYFDVMTIVFLGAYLFVDFLRGAERMETIKPQFLYLNIVNILVGLHIYFNPTLHVSGLFSILKKSYVFKAYLFFILLCGASVFVANNFSLWINSMAETLVVLAMLINIAILLYNRLHLFYRFVFIVSMAAFLQSFQALLDFKSSLGDKSVFESLEAIYSIRGNTGNVNIFAASLIAKLPFVLMGITYFTNWKKWLLLFTLTFATLVIFLISARASLISLFFVVVIYVIYYLNRNSINRKIVVKLAFIILPIVFSFAIVNYIFSKSNIGGRFSSTADRIKQINTSDASANLRLLYWKNAINFIKEKPVLGIGFGNWRIESIPYENSNLSLALSLHTHNDFLELTAETGVLNGLVYFSIFVALLVVNAKKFFKSKDETVKKIAILSLMLLIVYGVDALFNFPYYRPTMQVCFSFLLALTFVNSVNFPETPGFKAKNFVIILFIITVTPLYVIYHADKTSNLEFKIEADNIDFNAQGKLSGDEVINQMPLYPNVFNTAEPFYEYAAIYYLREKKYDKATKYFDIANKINPYLGRADFYKYVMANERGLADSSYKYIKSSFYSRPGNSSFFQQAVNMAGGFRDTTEILKMYKVSSSLSKNSSNWVTTAGALQVAGYSTKGMIAFLNQGTKDFPDDKSIKERYNTILITEYIIRGQNLFASSKPAEALQAYLKGYKLDPTNIYINQNIGFYYYNIGQPKQAIPYILRSIEKPGLADGKSEYFLGICYFNTSDNMNACKYIKISKDKGYPGAEGLVNQYCK